MWSKPLQHRFVPMFDKISSAHNLIIYGNPDLFLEFFKLLQRLPFENVFFFFCPSTGDVSPISMSPISQSQFIPLGDILCLAISAMNSARKTVTQETLVEHLAICFPGFTLPYITLIRISVDYSDVNILAVASSTQAIHLFFISFI